MASQSLGILLLALSVVGPMTLARPVAGAERDWPQWRGPTSSGKAEGTTFPATWPSSAPAPLWEAPLAEGWSSPVVAAGRVFVTDRNGNEERVLAFDAATGKQLWQQSTAVDFDPHTVGRRHGSGPKSTPVVDARFVYALGIAGRLQCLKAEDGAVAWQHTFPAEFAQPVPLAGNRAYVNGETNVIVPVADGLGGAVPLFGYTGSLVADGNLLIAPVGGARGATLMAFDKRTGQVVWRALHENVSYSSPIVADLAGVRQVVAMTGPNVVGLDVKDGRLLWSFAYQNQYDESIGTPVVADDLVLVTAVGRPLSAHKVTASDGQFRVAEVWRSDDLTSYLSSMLAHEGHVYGMNDGGEWHCLRLSDGTTVWRGGNHGFYSTPVLAEQRLLGLNEQGELAVFAAEPTAYKQEAMNKLSTEPTWTSPAVVGNRLFVRSRAKLVCFEIR
jgi:outer membrane protein assembly factor BamB